MQLTAVDMHGDDPSRLPLVVHQQIHHLILIEEGDVVLDTLLVHRLKDHVAGAIRGVTGAAHRLLSRVVGVAAKGALGDAAVRRTIERQAHVFQLVHHPHRLVAEDLHGVLVGQVVRALDGVERVPLGVIFFQVAQRRADAALRRARVRAGRIELADHSGLGALGGVQRGHQPGAACPDDDDIITMQHIDTTLLSRPATRRSARRSARRSDVSPGT